MSAVWLLRIHIGVEGVKLSAWSVCVRILKAGSPSPWQLEGPHSDGLPGVDKLLEGPGLPDSLPKM